MQVRYESVDELQKYLAREVFHYTESGKKAAGRALGTLVEVITFYLIESWGLRHSLIIEKALAEYGYPEISHNVEYTLHPVLDTTRYRVPDGQMAVSASAIRKALQPNGSGVKVAGPSHHLVNSSNVLRNCCIVYRKEASIVVAHIDREVTDGVEVALANLHEKPFAMIECKRVGIEEGMKKGPQTIEKAKQGAYVAKSVSNLQKIRLSDGTQGGVLVSSEKNLARVDRFDVLLAEILASNDKSILGSFILTIGVVSNHGNWFSKDSMNKETKLLAQAYDWLLFLTDKGLAEFINDLIVRPKRKYKVVSEAFRATYNGVKGPTRFTKTMIDFGADRCLHDYFFENQEKIIGWFNVLTPLNRNLLELKDELYRLRNKPWKDILK